MATWEHEVGEPLVFYFHVWELDPDQPRIKAVSKLNRVRQYRNLGEMPDRIRYYLNSTPSSPSPSTCNCRPGRRSARSAATADSWPSRDRRPVRADAPDCRSR